jgi:hypothetical protein
MNFTWKILELFAEAKSVRYLLKLTDEKNSVETEGNHTFSDGIVNLAFDQIKEANLIDWLEKDTIQNDVNVIKLNLEKQLKALENGQKVSFPWLADTFTPN